MIFTVLEKCDYYQLMITTLFKKWSLKLKPVSLRHRLHKPIFSYPAAIVISLLTIIEDCIYLPS